MAESKKYKYVLFDKNDEYNALYTVSKPEEINDMDAAVGYIRDYSNLKDINDFISVDISDDNAKIYVKLPYIPKIYVYKVIRKTIPPKNQDSW